MEAIGAVASILQISQLGLQLFQGLEKFATDAKRADKDLLAIASDVKHLSTVLEHAHGEIESGSKCNLYTDQAVRDFQDVLEGVHEAFQKIKSLLDLLTKAADGSAPPLKTRLRWAFNKKDEMQLLRSNLERLKTSLLLMLSVFNLALTRKSQTAIAQERSELEQHITVLHKQKATAEGDYQRLLSSVTKTPSSTEVIPQRKNVTVTGWSHGPEITATTSIPHPNPITIIGNDAVSRSLYKCATAAARLTESIDSAIQKWTAPSGWDPVAFSKAYEELFDALWRANDATHSLPKIDELVTSASLPKKMIQRLPSPNVSDQRPQSPERDFERTAGPMSNDWEMYPSQDEPADQFIPYMFAHDDSSETPEPPADTDSSAMDVIPEENALHHADTPTPCAGDIDRERHSPPQTSAFRQGNSGPGRMPSPRLYPHSAAEYTIGFMDISPVFDYDIVEQLLQKWTVVQV